MAYLITPADARLPYSCRTVRIQNLLQFRRWIAVAGLALELWFAAPACGETNALLGAALNSITAEELHDHVAVLADDVYEGRAAGSRGGHAAGRYIVKQLRQYSLVPAGTDGDYYQSYGDDDERNILVLLPGNDPRLD